MSKFSDRLKSLREARNLDQKDLSTHLDELGLGKTPQMISALESGRNKPKAEVLEALADYFDVSTDYLLGRTDTTLAVVNPISDNDTIRIPVIGRVAAGIPICAIEDVIDHEEFRAGDLPAGEYFGLRISGSSMADEIKDGDTVIVRRQEDAETGNIVVAIVNGDEGICKKLRKEKNGIHLNSLNPVCESYFFSNAEIEELPVRIIGVVMESRRKYF